MPRYLALALLLYAGVWAVGGVRSLVTGDRVEFKISDAWGYYAYLPSLVVDGNLDFAHQPMYGQEYPDAGRKINRWPVGLAVTLAPSFLLAHATAVPTFALTGWEWFRPDGYSRVYDALTLAQLVGMAAFSLMLGERLLRERYAVRPAAAFAAVLVVALGTHYLWYVVREPFFPHLANAAWVLIAAWSFHRAESAAAVAGARVWPWLASFGFACAMSVACRMTGALVLLPLVVALPVAIARRKRWAELAKVLPLLPLLALPVTLQAAAVRHATRLAAVSTAVSAAAPDAEAALRSLGYGPRESFHWTRPALVRTLFSSRNGLFFVSPVLLAAAVGLGRHLLRRGGWRDSLLIGLLLGWAILWYINSAWWAWWFGSAFGQRAMLAMTVLGILGTGLCFEQAAAAGPAARRRLRWLVLAGVAWCWLLFALRSANVLPHDDFVIPVERWTF